MASRQAGVSSPYPGPICDWSVHEVRGVRKARPEDEPGSRASRAGGDVQAHGSLAGGGNLRHELERAGNVAEHADRAGAADRDHVGMFASGTQGSHDLGDHRSLVRAGCHPGVVGGADEVNLGAKEMVEQQVALDLGRVRSRGQDEARAEPDHPARRCRHPGVVGLHATGRDEHRGAFAQRIGDEELQLAGLVPPAGEAGEVVALDEDPGRTPVAAEGVPEPPKLVKRRRQGGEPESRKTLQSDGDVGIHRCDAS